MAEQRTYHRNGEPAESLFDGAEESGDKPLFYAKRSGKWVGTSWGEVKDAVCRLAAALVEAGVTPGDRVLICAENRPEWAIADLAIMSIGGIVVPAYTTNTEDDHHYIIDHSGAVVAITSGGLLAKRLGVAITRSPRCG